MGVHWGKMGSGIGVVGVIITVVFFFLQSQAPPHVELSPPICDTPIGVSQSDLCVVAASDGTKPYEYKWDFGDGSQQETTDTTASHSYAKAGKYPGNVTVIDSRGTNMAQPLFVTVYEMTHIGESSKVHGSEQAPNVMTSPGDEQAPNVMQFSRSLLTSNVPLAQLGSGSISTSSPSNSHGGDRVKALIAVGNGPLGLASDPANGLIYVNNGDDNSVSVIDGRTNMLATGFTNPIAVGSAPYGIVASSAYDDIYVANLGSSNLSVIDDHANTLATGFTNPIPVGSFPNGVISVPNGNVYVVNNHGNSLSVIDGNPSHSVTFGTVISTIAIGIVGTSPNVDAFDPNNGYIYVTSNEGVYVVDSATNALATGFVNPIHTGATSGIAVDTTNNYIYAASSSTNTVMVINGMTNNLATGFANPIQVGSGPYGVAYDREDQSVYVANGGSDTVTKIVATTTPIVVQTIQVGKQPWGIAYDSKNNCIYVSNHSDNTVSVICPSGTLSSPASSAISALTNQATQNGIPSPATFLLTLSADQTNYQGSCPLEITFAGKIAAPDNYSGSISYQFVRSDGAISPAQSLTFSNGGSRDVVETWTLGGPDVTYSGWEAIHVLYPQEEKSDLANFKILCGPQ